MKACYVPRVRGASLESQRPMTRRRLRAFGVLSSSQHSSGFGSRVAVSGS